MRIVCGKYLRSSAGLVGEGESVIGMVRRIRIEIVAIVGMFAVGGKLNWDCRGVCRWREFCEDRELVEFGQ
jgi:hypothetical protein